jgi:hypothetical protein
VDKKRPKRTDFLMLIDGKDKIIMRSPLRLSEEIKNIGASPEEAIQVMHFVNNMLKAKNAAENAKFKAKFRPARPRKRAAKPKRAKLRKALKPKRAKLKKVKPRVKKTRPKPRKAAKSKKAKKRKR